jgi:hypothetical protein
VTLTRLRITISTLASFNSKNITLAGTPWIGSSA